jgi:hypothetical protein
MHKQQPIRAHFITISRKIKQKTNKKLFVTHWLSLSYFINIKLRFGFKRLTRSDRTKNYDFRADMPNETIINSHR